MALQLAQQRERHILRLARLAEQHHIGFFGRAAAFAVVAIAAGRDHIIPGGQPAARARQHVVDGQLPAARLGAAVLACFAVTSQYAAARAGQPQTSWNANIAYQPDNDWNVEGKALRAQALLGSLDKFGFFLQ